MVTAIMVKELRELTGAGMLDCKKALEETNGDISKASDWLREKGISKAAKKEGRIAAEGLVNIIVEGNKASIIEVNSETDFVASNEEFQSLIHLISKTVVSNDISTVEEALNIEINGSTLNDEIVNKIAKIGEKISFRRFKSIEKTDSENFGVYVHSNKKTATLVVIEGANEEVAKDVAMHATAMKPKYISKEEVRQEDIDSEREIQKQIVINEGKPANIADKIVDGKIAKYLKEICLNDQVFVKNPDFTIDQFVKNSNGKVKFMVRYEVGEGMEKRNDNFAEEVMNQIK